MDRDSPEDAPFFLIWVKTSLMKEPPKAVKQGWSEPSQTECYDCFDVRRRNFGLMKFQLLVEKRGKCQELDVLFLTKRRENVLRKAIA